ncbi:AraC family transcriptional regulator [Pseudomonas sp. N040]|uniref:AraC family transcriptional regulator n=1 Tax=Pseudomonas sp. N040 TaxID=2785325 RepID=UPI0018A337ED|nr:AraC family transcriptional regulator [Pseudomonas sp. N040]MBF7729109.1 AraC family transcriptional regulator [Pseudomonas sp. N040]MBW7012749.1 AraC family transcriptional regulator [Pseudomonas sp. N040]
MSAENKKYNARPERIFRRFADILRPYIAQAGLDEGFFTDSEYECFTAQMVLLLELAAQADDSVGLHIGQQTLSTDLGVLGQALRSLDKLGDTQYGLSRYLIVRGTIEQVEVQESAGQIFVSYRLADPATSLSRQYSEYILSLMLASWREVTGSRLTPLRVDFTHQRPADTGPLREFFGCPLYFEQPVSGLYIHKSVLEMPIVTADRRLFKALQPFLESQKEKYESDSLLVDVSQAIAAGLESNRSGLVNIADTLGMSVRTLQRRLSEQRLEFGDLVEDVRRALALEYVGKGAYRLTDVALMLGYNEPSSFSRAFRRWTGCSPQEYRKQSGHPPEEHGGSATSA